MKNVKKYQHFIQQCADNSTLVLLIFYSKAKVRENLQTDFFHKISKIIK